MHGSLHYMRGIQKGQLSHYCGRASGLEDKVVFDIKSYNRE